MQVKRGEREAEWSLPQPLSSSRVYQAYAIRENIYVNGFPQKTQEKTRQQKTRKHAKKIRHSKDYKKTDDKSKLENKIRYSTDNTV